MSNQNAVDAPLPSFEALYRANYRPVRALVRTFRFPSNVADDVIQDTFVTAWQKLETLQDKQAFTAWVLTIARFRCLRELRGTKRVVALAEQDYREDGEAQAVLVAADAADSFHHEHAVSAVQELVASFDQGIRGSVARLFYADELSVRHIAQQLSLPQSTVLSHLHRFRGAISKAALKVFEERGIELQMASRA